jgi:hypothetical protein
MQFGRMESMFRWNVHLPSSGKSSKLCSIIGVWIQGKAESNWDCEQYSTRQRVGLHISSEKRCERNGSRSKIGETTN